MHSVSHFDLSLLLAPIKHTVGNHLIEEQEYHEVVLEHPSNLWVWLILEDLPVGLYEVVIKHLRKKM